MSDFPENNDTAELTPQTDFDTPRLEFDFPGVRIGTAEYERARTGCTLFHFPTTARCAVDLRGGSAGTFMPGDGHVDAICYAGGSLYGLEASAGVAAELFGQRNFTTGFNQIAVVRGAIIYDFPFRANAIYPDKNLGRAALRAAKENIFYQGARGAGSSASVGKCYGLQHAESAGQGGAFHQAGTVKVAVFTVVNALGVIVNKRGHVVRGRMDRPLPEFKPAGGNTTLSILITNQALNGFELSQLARQVHVSLARAIHPFHTLDDGDVFYAVTTGEVHDTNLAVTALGAIASEVAWDAVLASIPECKS